MNKVIIMGRMTKDPDVRHSQNGGKEIIVSRTTLAVDRKFKKDGEQSADFINIVAFGTQAEFQEKYCKKGTKLCICGRIQTGSYTNKDGVKVYTFEVIVEGQDFCEKKEDNAKKSVKEKPTAAQNSYPQYGQYTSTSQQNGYQQVPQGYSLNSGYTSIPQQNEYPQGAQGYLQQNGYTSLPPQQGAYYRPAQSEGFASIPNGLEEELPFH